MTEIPPVGLSKKGGRYNGQFRPEFSRLHEDPDLLLVTPLPVRYIIGVIGRRWSGKSTTVATLHEELGFDNHSLVDIVRATAEGRGLDPTDRRVLQDLADTLRAEHVEPGAGNNDKSDAAYLARRMLRHIHDRHVHHSRRLGPPQRIVLSGFGHPAELEVFQRLPQFRMIRLVCADASREARAVKGRARKDATAFQFSCASDGEAFAAVDACDRDGASINAWAGSCAHSTGAVLERVEKIYASPDPGELEPDSLVFDLNTDSTPADQRERLEEIARLLDRRFRIL